MYFSQAVKSHMEGGSHKPVYGTKVKYGYEPLTKLNDPPSTSYKFINGVFTLSPIIMEVENGHI